MNLAFRKKLNIMKLAVILNLSAGALSSCAFLHAYSIVLAVDFDGNKVIRNEKDVVSYLENVVENYEDYSMKAFERKAISVTVDKKPGYIHCFYVIFNKDETYHTLSYSATGKFAASKGAWAMDTETDIESYVFYLSGDNKWEVEEITTKNGINTLLTINNVLSKIRNKTTYYFRSRVNKDNKHDNCYTALYETLAENDYTPNQ